MGELLKSTGSYPFMDRKSVVEDFNTTVQPGVYFISDSNFSRAGNPGIMYGLLIVYNATNNSGSTYITQIAFRVDSNESYYRSAAGSANLNNNPEWRRIG